MLFLSADELESLRGPVGGGGGGGGKWSSQQIVPGGGGGGGGGGGKEASTLPTLLPVILPNKAIYATTSWGSKVSGTRRSINPSLGSRFRHTWVKRHMYLSASG